METGPGCFAGTAVNRDFVEKCGLLSSRYEKNESSPLLCHCGNAGQHLQFARPSEIPSIVLMPVIAGRRQGTVVVLTEGGIVRSWVVHILIDQVQAPPAVVGCSFG